MAQMLVRNIDEDVIQRLKGRARQEGRSLQAEVRRILAQAAREPTVDMESARKFSERIRRKFKGRKFPPSVELIRENRTRLDKQ